MRGFKFNRGIVLGAVTLILSVFSSCVGAPAPAESAPKAPGWTMETPAPDATYTYFVGNADGLEGEEAKASDTATANMISEIMRYIGVTITAESTATAKSTLDEFQADLVQTVRQSSTSRMSGFQVSEKFKAERKGGITVYLLGRFETKALEAERRRIAAVFQEKLDAVAKPEAEARSLLMDGNAVAAARKFIEAAAAASGSDIENAAIKFERNINGAKDAISRIVMEKLNDKLEGKPGTPFAEAFKAIVKVGGEALGGIPVTVSHPSKLASGRMSTKSVNLVSDKEGLVQFVHPNPDFVGKATLTMRLDLSSATEPLYGIPDKYMSMVAGLEDEISAKRVVFEYSVLSGARKIPTMVLIADIDVSGKVSAGTSSSALVAALASNGFMVNAAPLAVEDIAAKDDNAIYESVKAALAGKTERFVYGTTRVLGVKDDKGQKIATVSADIKVIELATGRILYAATKQASTVAASEQQAVESARRQLGQKTIGEDLASNLP